MTKIDAAALLHRTFLDPNYGFQKAMQQTFESMRRGIPPSNAPLQASMAAGRTTGIGRRLQALRLTRNNSVEQVWVDEWKGQKFAEYATEWERAHSNILRK